MNFDPQKIFDVDTNIKGETITMPVFQAVSIAAPGATQTATAVFPFFDPDIDSTEQAFGWRYPVGTRGGKSDRNWRECVCCNFDAPSDDYQIINGKAYCISHGCLEQKLAQLEEGGPLFENTELPPEAFLMPT